MITKLGAGSVTARTLDTDRLLPYDPRIHAGQRRGDDVRKIDAFAHILPPAYARRLESIMSGPVSDRILGYQPWIHEDPALTGLDQPRFTPIFEAAARRGGRPR